MNLFKLFVCVIFTYTLISCGGAEERKAVYMEKALSSMESGNFEKARIELKNVLQIDPKDSEAYFQLGKIFEQKSDYRKAFGYYTKAADLAPDNYENQSKLGRFYLIFAGDKKLAKEKMDLILSKEPENIYGLLLKSTILVVDKKIPEALQISEDIFKRNPSYIDNTLFLSSIYLEQKQPEKAIEVLESTLEKNKDNDEVTQKLAKTLLMNEEYDRAEVLYKERLAKKPDLFGRYAALAVFYNVKGDKAKAKSVLVDAIENDPDDVTRRLTLLQLIQKNEGLDSAKKELEKQIKSKPNLGELRLVLGGLYVQEKNFEKAKSVYEQAVTDFSEDATGITSRVVLATLYINKKQFDKAKKELNDALEISPNDPDVNLQLAKLAFNDKDYDKAILALRVVVKQSPDNIDAYFILAAAHIAKGEREQADAIIKTAYDNNRANKEALLKLAIYYGKKDDVEETEKIIDNYLTIDSNNYEAITIKTTLLNKQGRFAEAKKYADKLMEMYPDKANGYIQSVPSLAKEGKQDEAVALLKKGYDKVKDNFLILRILTSIQLSSSADTTEVEKRINDAISESKDDVRLHLLLARVYLSKKGASKAEEKLREIISDYPDNEEAYGLLADEYIKAGNKDGYASIISEGHKNIPGSLKLAIAQARLYEVEKNYDNAIEVYKGIVDLYPDNVIAVNNLASLLSDHRSDEASLKQARELADKLAVTDKPVLLDTVGWVYYKTGDYQAAIDVLKNVVDKIPDANVFNYHLGMAYSAAGDKVNAELYLNRSLKDGKDFSGISIAKETLKNL